MNEIISKKLLIVIASLLVLAVALYPKQTVVVAEDCKKGSRIEVKKDWRVWWMIPSSAATNSYIDFQASMDLSAGHILRKGDYTVLGFQLTPKGKVVVSTQEIPEGAKITLENSSEEEVLQSKIPKDAITSFRNCLDKTAKHAIIKGNIIEHGDLAN